MRDLINPRICTDLRIEGRANWKNRIGKKEEKLSFAETLIGLCGCNPGNPLHSPLMNILFKFLDNALETDLKYKKGEIHSIESIKKFDFPTYLNNEPHNVQYFMINFEEGLGHLALSFPIDEYNKRKRRVNLFYSPSKEGALETIARISENPLNPCFHNLKNCIALTQEQPYF